MNELNIPELSVSETHTLWQNPPQDWHLIDVREDEEVQEAHIPGSEWIPLSDFLNKSTHLNPKDSYVIYCKSGGRSAHVTAYLKQNGFENVANMTGGILAWKSHQFETLP